MLQFIKFFLYVSMHPDIVLNFKMLKEKQQKTFCINIFVLVFIKLPDQSTWQNRSGEQCGPRAFCYVLGQKNAGNLLSIQ